MQLRNYQKQVVDQIVSADPFKGVLRIDTRLGKSVISITAACSLRLRRVTVVCPAFLIPTWKKECKKWGNGCTEFVFRSYAYYSSKTKKPVVEEYEMLILDESHYIRGEKSNRSKALSKHISAAKRFLGLSATPMVKGATDLYWTLKGLEAEELTTLSAYRQKFCRVEMQRWGKRMGLRFYGTNPHTEDELRQICNRYFIHLRKKDVWKDLPQKTIDRIEFDVPKVNIEDSVLIDFIEKLKQGVVSEVPEVKSARLELGLSKVGKVVKFCEGLSGQYVVFTWHRGVAEAITEELRKLYPTGCIMGGQAGRQDSVERFNNGDYRAIVCTMASSGVGLDFSNADCAVFAELPYTPAELEQCEARIENINRKKPVNIFHLLAKHKLDKRVIELLEEKRVATRIME